MPCCAGRSVDWSRAKGNLKVATIVSLVRLIAMPIVLLSICILVGGFRGAQLGALFSLFCTPTAVNSYVMAKNMHNDADLAGQLVIMTTLLSGFTIFGGIALLRGLECFSRTQAHSGSGLTEPMPRNPTGFDIGGVSMGNPEQKTKYGILVRISIYAMLLLIVCADARSAVYYSNKSTSRRTGLSGRPKRTGRLYYGVQSDIAAIKRTIELRPN